jgi:hypothetical protein
MMEAVLASETSVNFNVITRFYIPEDSKLHTPLCENLKSHIKGVVGTSKWWEDSKYLGQTAVYFFT